MKLLFLLVYNFFRIALLKIRFFQKTDISWLQRISPCCAIKLFGQCELCIGRNCHFENGCDLQVHHTGILKIGQRVYMNRYCMVSAHGYVEIGDNCIFGPGVRIFDNNHKFSKENGANTELKIGSVKIGRNCWIASDVIILKGADIGDNCVIGAGCIINGSIPSGSLVRPNTNNIVEPIYK